MRFIAMRGRSTSERKCRSLRRAASAASRMRSICASASCGRSNASRARAAMTRFPQWLRPCSMCSSIRSGVRRTRHSSSATCRFMLSGAFSRAGTRTASASPTRPERARANARPARASFAGRRAIASSKYSRASSCSPYSSWMKPAVTVVLTSPGQRRIASSSARLTRSRASRFEWYRPVATWKWAPWCRGSSCTAFSAAVASPA